MTGQTSVESVSPSAPRLPPHRRTVLAGVSGIGLVSVLRRAQGYGPRKATPNLSSLQWAGQRVIYSYPGLTVPSALLTAIEAGQCAGVIFFGENISSASQIAGVVSRLRAYTTGQLEPTAFDAALARVQALRSSLS